MPRSPDTGRIAEYHRLFDIYEEALQGLQELGVLPAAPDTRAARWEGQGGFGTYLSGVRQAIGDMVEISQFLEGSQSQALNSRLQSRGFPTLTALAAQCGALLRQVQARGRIVSDEEFYLVSAAIADTANDTLTSSAKARLEAIAAAYEQSNRRDAG